MLVRRKKNQGSTEVEQGTDQVIASTDWLPGRHFRLVSSKLPEVRTPKALRPSIQRSVSGFCEIHVGWPDTITCNHCRCIIALPAPARCPLCRQNVPAYYVDKDAAANQDAPPTETNAIRPVIFRAPT